MCFVHPQWSFHYLNLPCKGHMKAKNNSSQMLKLCLPMLSEMHICDKSAVLSGNLASRTISPPLYIFSWHWQIVLIDFVRAIVITPCWAKAQVSLPLITIARTQIFAPAALQASSVAQFLVPFPVNRQWFHIASGICAHLPAGEASS